MRCSECGGTNIVIYSYPLEQRRAGLVEEVLEICLDCALGAEVEVGCDVCGLARPKWFGSSGEAESWHAFCECGGNWGCR